MGVDSLLLGCGEMLAPETTSPQWEFSGHGRGEEDPVGGMDRANRDGVSIPGGRAGSPGVGAPVAPSLHLTGH